MELNIQDFQDCIPKLSQGDRSFATNLYDSWKRGRLSDKQSYWIGVLLKRAAGGGQPAPTVQIGAVDRIRRMFDTAATKLKFPKIWLGTPASPIRLSIAGPTSKNAGSIVVTDGRPYGVNRYYGAIDRNGQMKPGRDLTPAISAELTALANDPEGKAAEFGRLTGHCCFCNAALTDDRSIDVGYGPVCAKNFGLAWGRKEAVAA